MSVTKPKIIQGGMGIHLSSWKLAKAVALKGQLGVVSGTAIDTVVSRVLQKGDIEGNIRRALEQFPLREMANRVKERFFVEGGKKDDKPFKNSGMPGIQMGRAKTELLIVSNFIEVFLAKENHSGTVGINYLEKIQTPTLPSLFGAMLAGVNVVLMGAGIPTAIPGVLDGLAAGEEVTLKIAVEENETGENFIATFNPNDYLEGATLPKLTRPDFLAIVSTDIVARQMERKASGLVNGYVIENYTAGGHNAPPRRNKQAADGSLPEYTEKDMPNMDKIRGLDKPFWLAGKYSSPEKLKEALAEGATGVQLGTPFAYSNESEMLANIKQEVIKQSVAGEIDIETSFVASPTGYPFKLVHPKGEPFSSQHLYNRKRVCDMGLLRNAYVTPEGKVGWRCPAEPIQDYVKKGGKVEDTEGRLCLCNGLISTVGYGQLRKQDGTEPVMLTSGDEVLNLKKFLKEGETSYSASDVIDYVLS